MVTLFGGPKALELATCSPPGGIGHASNTGQNGTVANATFPLQVSGCPPPPKKQGQPKLSGVSLTGLAGGKPSLSFSVAHGTNAPNLKRLSVSLPAGLKFKSKKGISVGGSHTLRIAGGRLIITLKRPGARVAVRIGSGALSESKQLQLRARKGKAHPKPRVRVTVTDAAGTQTTLSR